MSQQRRREGLVNFRYDHDLSPECRYCGEAANGRDHVPPLRFAMTDMEAPRGTSWLIVSACRECNCLLGSRPLMTLTARREFLKARYRKRYARALEAPIWTAEELAELGPGLKTAVLTQEGERRRAIRRIRRLAGY